MLRIHTKERKKTHPKIRRVFNYPFQSNMNAGHCFENCGASFNMKFVLKSPDTKIVESSDICVLTECSFGMIVMYIYFPLPSANEPFLLLLIYDFQFRRNMSLMSIQEN